MPVRPFFWKKSRLFILDQRYLPHKKQFMVCHTPQDVARAIREMAVRGAPAIGCVAAFGMALAVKGKNGIYPKKALANAARILKQARPTAVNLAWAVNRMQARHSRMFLSGIQFNRKNLGPRQRHSGGTTSGIFKSLVKEAIRISDEDVANNIRLSKYGARLFKKKSIILTHCNAGALATAGVGTSLGVIKELFRRGKLKKLMVDETRPFLQGARLTAWECVQEKIPHELITDNMAAYFMENGEVDGIIVGCDRVAANGDTANKIGTYNLGILAQYHKIPFYVALPTSTLDLNIKSGKSIPIEERDPEEVVQLGSIRTAPKKTRARHPAFDVTPASLITAFVTERGIVRRPYKINLNKLKKSS